MFLPKHCWASFINKTKKSILYFLCAIRSYNGYGQNNCLQITERQNSHSRDAIASKKKQRYSFN